MAGDGHHLARRVVTRGVASAYEPIGDWVKEKHRFLNAPTGGATLWQRVADLEAADSQAPGLEVVMLRNGKLDGFGTVYPWDGSAVEVGSTGRRPWLRMAPGHHLPAC